MIINWIKHKLGISAIEQENKEFRRLLDNHKKFVIDKVTELQKYTRVDADVGFRGNNTVVLTGVYKNKAYVQFYDVGDAEFKRLAEMLKDMKGHALIRHVDAPASFRGVFEI